jgi:hypothetical protein
MRRQNTLRPILCFSIRPSVQTRRAVGQVGRFSIGLEWFRGRFDNRELCPFQRHWDVWTLRKWRNCLEEA